MKKVILFFALCMITITSVYAGNDDVKQLIDKGNKAFIIVIDTNDNIDNEYNLFVKMLTSKEWNKWDLVEKKEDADFVCTLILKKKGAGFSMSYGKRVDATVEISSVDGVKVWESKKHTGNTNEFTGFNALADVMRKITRRALTDELYKEIINKK